MCVVGSITIFPTSLFISPSTPRVEATDTAPLTFIVPCAEVLPCIWKVPPTEAFPIRLYRL